MKKLIPIMALLLLFGCNTKTNVVTVSDDARDSASGGTSGGSTGGGTTDPVIGDDETPPPVGCTAEGVPRGDTYGTMPYHTFEVISRGNNSVNTDNWHRAWESNDFSHFNHAFVTDSNLKFRVMARNSPGRGSDSYGTNCQYVEIPYTMLKIQLGIRKSSMSPGSYYSTKTFYNVKVNDCSEKWQPSYIPTNSSSDPFVVDVMKVEWNWNCPNGETMCEIMSPDCVAYDIQMATDQTVMLPEKN